MYKVEFTGTAVKSLKKIDKSYQTLILDKIALLAKNPKEAANIKALKGLNGYYRLRVANYRVIYELIDKEIIILIIDINHRKDIYR